MPANILVCLDTDPQPSVFDAVTAIDAGADHLLRHGGVTAADVEPLVHGAMFTRGPDQLKHTAVFIGGSDVAAGEGLLAAATGCFFGPMRVSVLLDSNGCNTTAAAAVIAAGRCLPLRGAAAVVIGSGPVGQRAAQLLAGEGALVKVVSRKADRAAAVCERLAGKVDAGLLEPVGQDQLPLADILKDAQVLIAAGPAGVEVICQEAFASADSLKVAIDLNAAPPVGIGGFEATDKAVDRGGCACYGAIGVGGTKMKIHRAALQRLFESNDAVLDAAEVYAIGKAMDD
ncbi:Bifunctional protein MdtA [Posidoniimonas corsicana]|uniref:Bifunctional protein MdtA n=1 Tax=Posidoniimonas corsicana TaxID=1938618 RepID=A0A5C5VEG9_9BACT|nr:methylene-tetrahydromethanopterin dehydrogenase N-terminal domain-containing protein [Posidoniimonas corsicana]TWT37036.1 Bifunctional protein MdtA [Posidoniimonas corsicana]